MNTFWHIDGRIMNRGQLDEWKRKKAENGQENMAETQNKNSPLIDKSLDELKKMAKEKKIKGFGIMKKETLIKFLTQ